MRTNEFTAEIEQAYKKYFPDSHIRARFDSNLYGNIWVNCFLVSDKSELSGGYWENDILHIRFRIQTTTGEFSKDITKESQLPDNLMLEVIDKSYFIKPASRMMAYGRRDMSWRKTKGDAAKILNYLDKCFSQLRESLVNDLTQGMIESKEHHATAIKKLGQYMVDSQADRIIGEV